MIEIELNDIKEAIAVTLDNEFGYTVHGEEIEQGFVEPCFFIEVLNTTQRRIGARRNDRRQSFCIHFFPERDGDMNTSIFRMGEELYRILEFLDVKGGEAICRGSGMNYVVSGSVLNFFIDYNYHLIEPLEKGKIMENLIHEKELRNE